MSTAIKFTGITTGIVSLIALNWWTLFTTLANPSHSTIGRLYVITAFSGALAGAKIGWDVCDLKRGQAKNSSRVKGGKG